MKRTERIVERNEQIKETKERMKDTMKYKYINKAKGRKEQNKEAQTD
jgi:hypothetical protein